MLVRWFKSWRENRKLRAHAKTILSNPQASIDALIHAKGIIDGLNERKDICRHCYQPYTPKERSFAEQFQVRSILMIPDNQPDPKLCDSCYVTAVSVYNQHSVNIGTSNSGPTNLTLKNLH